MVKTGTTCNRVRTKEACEQAAGESGLNLYNTIPDEADDSDRPPYCYTWEHKAASHYHLYFNTNSASSTACGEPEGTYWCICDGGSSLQSQPTYNLVTSGSSCNRVTTISECETAARALGLSDTTAEYDEKPQNRLHWRENDPPYCYYWIYRTNNTKVLKFNPGGTNTGPCLSFDQCICKNIV